MGPSDLARKAAEALSTSRGERINQMARGYLALTQGNAEEALWLLAADRAIEQDALIEATRNISAGYVRRRPSAPLN